MTETVVTFWILATLIYGKPQAIILPSREQCVAYQAIAEESMSADGDGDGDMIVDCRPVELTFRSAAYPL